MDRTKPMLRFRVLNKEYACGKKTFNNIFQPVVLRAKNKVREEFWKFGLDIVERCFEERVNYWNTGKKQTTNLSNEREKSRKSQRSQGIC